MTDDPALDTLWHPFATGALAWPAEGEALFLRARPDPGLSPARSAQLRFRQSFKPVADELRAMGIAEAGPKAGDFPLVLLLPPRQREEARALLAQAVRAVAAGGVVVASQANNEGARSGEADLRELAGNVASLSKNKCRVFWSRVDADAKASPRVEAWLALDAPRRVAGDRFWSRPGLFAWDRIDPASALLAEHLPSGLSGSAADLGAGYGYLAAELLARNPGLASLDLFEAEARALDMARRNLAERPAGVEPGFHWHDVRAGLPGHYDLIVSNPPFHLGRADVPELGRDFIRAAARALRPGGRLLLVANRHLAYEAVLQEHFEQVRVLATRDGFKVIEATGARA